MLSPESFIVPHRLQSLSGPAAQANFTLTGHYLL